MCMSHTRALFSVHSSARAETRRFNSVSFRLVHMHFHLSFWPSENVSQLKFIMVFLRVLQGTMFKWAALASCDTPTPIDVTFRPTHTHRASYVHEPNINNRKCYFLESISMRAIFLPCIPFRFCGCQAIFILAMQTTEFWEKENSVTPSSTHSTHTPSAPRSRARHMQLCDQQKVLTSAAW